MIHLLNMCKRLTTYYSCKSIVNKDKQIIIIEILQITIIPFRYYDSK